MTTARKKTRQRLPGDISHKHYVARALRVDHAGEFGAKQIYAGQLAVLGKKPVGKTIQHMAAQEEEHWQAFEKMLRQRRVRPTALMPFWRVAGFALGAGTAMLGPRAAMACTVAVEEVIIDHYQKQIEYLGDDEVELVRCLKKFRDDEDDHRATGCDHDATTLPYYPLLRGAIRRGCRLAIWLSERV